MSRFNEFVISTTCQHCGNEVRMRFQASIGALDLRVFEQGEQVIDIPSEFYPPIFGDGPRSPDQDFWAYGLTRCPACDRYIWSKINIRSGKFDSISLIQDVPSNMYGWGLL